MGTEQEPSIYATVPELVKYYLFTNYISSCLHLLFISLVGYSTQPLGPKLEWFVSVFSSWLKFRTFDDQTVLNHLRKGLILCSD